MGEKILAKHYMVFDSTPTDPTYRKNYLRIGFAIGDAGELPGGNTKTFFDKLVKEFLPLVIALGAVIVLSVAAMIYFYC